MDKISTQNKVQDQVEDESTLKSLIFTYGEGTKDPVNIKKIHFNITLPDKTVNQLNALVNIDFFVLNDKIDRNMNGVVTFVLPDDSQLTGYSVTTDSGRIKATCVPKEKAARVAYQERERGKSVSTSEKLEGNMYQLNIFPLIPNKEQCVTIELVCPINDDKILFPFKLDNLAEITFDGTGSFKCSFDETLSEGFRVELDNSTGNSSDPVVICGLFDNLVHFNLGIPKGYILSEFNKPSAKTINYEQQTKSTNNVNNVCVIWDTSQSCELDDKTNISEFFNSLDINWNYALYGFNTNYQKIGENFNHVNIVKAIDKIKYDGGTDLSILDEIFNSTKGQYDKYILVTDGVDNIANTIRLPLSITELGVPVDTIIPNIDHKNTSLLKCISYQTFGFCGPMDKESAEFISGKKGQMVLRGLELLEETDEDSNSILLEEDFETCPNCKLQSGLLYKSLEKGLLITGTIDPERMTDVKGFNLDILDTATGNVGQITILVDLLIKNKELNRLVAVNHCNNLIEDSRLTRIEPDFSKHYIKDLALKYGVASDYTSLLLLFTAKQFVRNEVDCPKDHPEYEKWLALKALEVKRTELFALKKQESLILLARKLVEMQYSKMSKKDRRKRKNLYLENTVLPNILSIYENNYNEYLQSLTNLFDNSQVLSNTQLKRISNFDDEIWNLLGRCDEFSNSKMDRIKSETGKLREYSTKLTELSKKFNQYKAEVSKSYQNVKDKFGGLKSIYEKKINFRLNQNKIQISKLDRSEEVLQDKKISDFCNRLKKFYAKVSALEYECGESEINLSLSNSNSNAKKGLERSYGSNECLECCINEGLGDFRYTCEGSLSYDDGDDDDGLGCFFGGSSDSDGGMGLFGGSESDSDDEFEEFKNSIEGLLRRLERDYNSLIKSTKGLIERKNKLNKDMKELFDTLAKELPITSSGDRKHADLVKDMVSKIELNEHNEALKKSKNVLDNYESPIKRILNNTNNKAYLIKINNSDDPIKTYFNEKCIDDNKKSPSFYIYCSKLFHAKGFDPKICINMITNALEFNIKNVQLFRSIAYFMMELKDFDKAIDLFREIKSRAPGEPQSYMDLALSLFFKLRFKLKQDSNNSKVFNSKVFNSKVFNSKVFNSKVFSDEDKKDLLKEVVDNLAEVLIGRWAFRFQEIEWIANIWLNWVVNYAKFIGLGDIWPESIERDIFQINDLEMDIVVAMAWDTDRTDIDLHIYEPDKYHVYYGNRTSPKGGYLSKDFTQGYGPECYIIKEAELGVYEFRTKYFASHQASRDTGTTSSVIWSVKNFGSYDKEIMQFSMVRLEVNKDDLQVFLINTIEN